jgi:photosystem II stability/assembly factor-like uncharacterized protein
MKKLVISILILMYSSLFAQSGWYPLNSGTSENLSSVFFTDNNTGYVIGFNGTALKTTNAGVNWFVQTITTTEILRCVLFTDVNTGYIVSGSGNNIGNVYKTTNAGNTWNALPLPQYTHFYCVYFINSNTGYVSGYGAILKTTNAGSTWDSQTFTGLGFISSIYFVNVNTGFACTYNSYKILKTINGGVNWQEIFTNTEGFFGISFIDANTGTAVGGYPSAPGNAFILRTTNGGLNWTNYVFNNSNICYLWSVKFLNTNIGFITGGSPLINSTILKTTNGGLNWYPQITSANDVLKGNYFTSLNTGYVVGSSGTILKTTDGGNFVGINPVTNEVPAQFSLSQNYPNPFNPVTKIKFDISKTGFVRIIIYDMLGRELKTLINEQLNAGTYEAMWTADKFSSGVYFYTLTTESFRETKRMVLIK